ncbi:MAG: MutS-related protein [Ktedonobacterales bacterium]
MQAPDQEVVKDQPAAEDMPEGPEAVYQARCRQFGHQQDYYARLSQQTGGRNVMLFFGSVLCLFVAAFGGSWLFFILALGLFVAFVVSFIRLGKINLQVKRYREYGKINSEGLSRLSRDWASLPLRQPKDDDAPLPPYATDLDLLGRASLQHLLSTPTTGNGLSILRNWLLEPASAAEINERQKVVAELAPMIDFRDDFELSGRLMSDGAESVYQVFLGWAESGPWLSKRPVLIWLSRILPVLTIGLLIAQLTHLAPYPLWLAPLLIGILVIQADGKPVEVLLDEVSDRQRVFQPYSELFALVSQQNFTAPRLRALVNQLTAGGQRADQQMSRLARILQFGDLRRSMIFPLIQAVLLWNFHTLWMLEGWQRDTGQYARSWLEALGTLEAYTALATLAYDHPDWVFPEVTNRGAGGRSGSRGKDQRTLLPVLAARNLGHPLLPDESCVGNDVSIGPAGTFLLVTGSNMSGKSTLLRAIGTNIVLAQAGGPVCASWFRLAPVTLATSIRVQDSLEQGVSYYMAELQRLKQVVDSALEAQAEGDRILLFLLDEILHGTNTSERQIAARHIIGYLLSIGATGAVSTHDLTLADSPQFNRSSTLVHFTEQFERGADGRPIMSFDYKLRPGLATSTNALKLMEIVGLPLPDTAGSAAPSPDANSGEPDSTGQDA